MWQQARTCLPYMPATTQATMPPQSCATSVQEEWPSACTACCTSDASTCSRYCSKPCGSAAAGVQPARQRQPKAVCSQLAGLVAQDNAHRKADRSTASTMSAAFDAAVSLERETTTHCALSDHTCCVFQAADAAPAQHARNSCCCFSTMPGAAVHLWLITGVVAAHVNRHHIPRACGMHGSHLVAPAVPAVAT